MKEGWNEAVCRPNQRSTPRRNPRSQPGAHRRARSTVRTRFVHIHNIIIYIIILLHDLVTDIHTTMHTLRTKDHTLIIGPNIQHVIILSGHDPNPAADVETPICMRSGWKYIDAAENEESQDPLILYLLSRLPLPGHSYILSPFDPYIAFMHVQFMYISIIYNWFTKTC